MLKNIILICDGLYLEKEKSMPEWDFFIKEMEKRNYKVLLKAVQEVECVFAENRLQDSLIISDNGEILERLKEEGGYTIACYHEGITGLMGCTQFAIEGLDGLDFDYLEKVYQRYCGIPWYITETERCTVREMGPDDLDDLYELYADKRVTRYTEVLFTDKEREKHYIKDYIENIYKYFGFGTWLIHRKEDGRLIGRAGFNYRPGFEEAELGFVIGYPFWRNGYAYEVCSHLLYLGKTVFEFDKVQALVDKENTASLCLLEKLGFYYIEDVTVDEKEYRRYLHD